MATQAEKLADAPTKAVEEIVATVQEVANSTQSYAYQYEIQEDNSVLEIRCSAVPRLAADEAPPARAQFLGMLCDTPDGLLVCLPHNADETPNEDGERYGWVPASTRTRKFADFCGLGGSKLVAHIQADFVEPF